jgi:predicted amidohydrolase
MIQIRERRGLIALNAALLLVLAAVTLAPASHAQRATGGNAAGRARGDYTMVSGKVTGGNSHAVYVVDANNQETLALLWNQSAKGLEPIGYRDQHADSAAQPGR